MGVKSWVFKISGFKKPFYKIGEVADILGVTPKTIQNYDSQGKIETIRSDGGHRIISKEALIKYLSERGLIIDDTICKRDIIYARVSRYEKSDLDGQIMEILLSVTDLKNPLVLQEVGSGLNDNRSKLVSLIDMVLNGEVHKVYVTHRDRLAILGYNYLEYVFSSKGVEIVALHEDVEGVEKQREVVEDMTALLHSFSGKLYSIDSHGQKIS